MGQSGDREPDDVHVVVTESGMDSDVPRTFSNGDEAWSINGDGTHIDFHGDFCSAVMAGYDAFVAA